MKCPYIVRLMGPKAEMTDVKCPDLSQRCWVCKVGANNPAFPKRAPAPKRFYEEQI